MIQLGDFRHFEILVVDDQRFYRDAIGKILADLGCWNVRLVDWGLGALTEVCRRHPDVIVMDVLMPGMDGLTASTVIRDYEASQGRRAFIFGLSNREPDWVQAYCIEAGMDCCLGKPIDPGALEEFLRLTISVEVKLGSRGND